MYTRSYGNKRTGRMTEATPPPDYGGTALVIKQNGHLENQGTKSASGSAIVADRIPRRREFRDNVNERKDTSARKKLDSEESNSNSQGEGRFESPFGENGGQFESASSTLKKLDKAVAGFINPENLKSDDLLLLGLIFLLFKEGADNDGAKEAIMLLAILYLSGL